MRGCWPSSAPSTWGRREVTAGGELDFEGIRILRWALLGLISIYLLLAVAAFLT